MLIGNFFNIFRRNFFSFLANFWAALERPHTNLPHFSSGWDFLHGGVVRSLFKGVIFSRGKHSIVWVW